MSVHTKGSDRRLDLVSMGCRWVLDLSALDATEAAEMTARWQRCRDLATSATPVLDDTAVTLTAAAPAAPYDLSRELTRQGLLRLVGRVTLLHAAALSDGDGRTLALVAPSGGGKSTATRVLGTRMGYVSDESLVLLEGGRIAPHPKPPSLILDPADPFTKVEPSPDELGLGPTPAGPHLTALLTLDRDASLDEPVIEEVGLLDQLLAVIPETSSTWWLDDGLDRLARAITVGGPPARLRYAEIDTCHDLVRDHLAAAAPGRRTWEHLPPVGEQRLPRTGPTTNPTPPTPEVDAVELADDDRLVRGRWSDALAVDGEVLVLAGSRPLRLGGAGAVVWRAAQSPTRLDDLVARAVASLGEHPQAAEIVRGAVAQLVEHEVLRRV